MSNQFSGKIVGVSLVIAILAVAFLGIVAYSAMSAKASQADTGTNQQSEITNTTQSTITVTGTGVATGVPDEIQIVLGVTTLGPNATQVLLQNSANMTNAINAIEKNVGINNSDIQTVNFNFNPTYAEGTNTINGYQASNQIQINLQGSQVSLLDPVINAAVNAGANTIQSIQYVLSNSLQAKLQNDALVGAIQSANQTAQLSAKSEGLNVVGIQSVTILGNNSPQPYDFAGEAAPMYTVESSATVNYNVPISPGQTQYSMEVQVIYLLS
jgi:uncharacterized protein